MTMLEGEFFPLFSVTLDNILRGVSPLQVFAPAPSPS